MSAIRSIRPRFAVIWTALALALLMSPIAAAAATEAATDSTTAAETAEAPFDTRGFLYGKITTRSGAVYEGQLRWGDDEAFWTDPFDAVKRERPAIRMMPAERREEPFKILGFSLGSSEESRQLSARFGDVRHIEVRSRGEAEVTMKSGTVVGVDGGSDIGRSIKVWDPRFDSIELRWREIRSIELLPTPADLDVDVRRLYGTVTTSVGTFEGFIKWDRDECLNVDKLDGDIRDGTVSIRMGKIQVIEKRSPSSARVVLVNGRELVLDGSNDVNHENRGILVEDPRYGRVVIGWRVFERLELSTPAGSGPSNETFTSGEALRARVTTKSGETHRGRLVWDFDETEDWDLLSGHQSDIEYFMPFSQIAEIVPEDELRSRVVLRDGEELVLTDSVDVDQDNDGLVVFPEAGGEPIYVAWEQVARVELVE